jgi:hypothetical protein
MSPAFGVIVINYKKVDIQISQGEHSSNFSTKWPRRSPELNSQEKPESEARPTLAPNAVERASKQFLRRAVNW